MSRTLEGRLVLALFAALLALHVALTILDLAGASWRQLPVTPASDSAWLPSWPPLVWLLGVALAAAGQLGSAVKPPVRALARARPGWGDVLALGAGGVLAVVSYRGWSTNPDFVYHWGLKGYRFAVQGGIDYDFLSRPWNGYLHPDYPQLLPELYAFTALVRGSWDESVLLLWTVVWFVALVLAARAVLRGAAVDDTVGRFVSTGVGGRFAQQALLAALALALAMLGVGYQLAGSPDWLIALALVAALPAFLLSHRRPADGDRRDVAEARLARARGEAPEIALIAAVVAAVKVEGVVLAAGMLLGWALLRGLWRPGPRWAGWRLAVLTALPASLLVATWLWQVRTHGLLSQSLLGPPRWENMPGILAAIWRALNTQEWHSLGLLLLFLPLLALVRRVRPLALLALAQLGFYLAVYVCAQERPEFYVLSSFPRLMLHLWPATLVAAGLVLARWVERPAPLVPVADGSSRDGTPMTQAAP